MSSDPLERAFRRLLHQVRMGREKPTSLADALKSAPKQANAPGREPQGLYQEDFAKFQELIELGLHRYCGLIPGVILDDDVMPAKLQTEMVRNYFGDLTRQFVVANQRSHCDAVNAIHREFDARMERSEIESRPFPTFLPTALAIEIFVARFAHGLRRAALVAGGVPVTVHSMNSGYAVRYTPRWLFSVNAFGSSLTTPVTDHLSPASYRFGGDKSGALIWDSTIHAVTAPNTSTTVTAF
jgi:hypothetical protein